MMIMKIPEPAKIDHQSIEETADKGETIVPGQSIAVESSDPVRAGEPHRCVAEILDHGPDFPRDRGHALAGRVGGVRVHRPQPAESADEETSVRECQGGCGVLPRSGRRPAAGCRQEHPAVTDRESEERVGPP